MLLFYAFDTLFRHIFDCYAFIFIDFHAAAFRYFIISLQLDITFAIIFTTLSLIFFIFFHFAADYFRHFRRHFHYFFSFSFH
jgi:hypothetical protein